MGVNTIPEITLLGSSGYIGSAFLSYCKNSGISIESPKREELHSYKHKRIKTLLWCIGITSDFHTRLYETVEISVSYLNEFLYNNDIEQVVYMSSTRIFKRNTFVTEETMPLLLPSCKDDVYALSKVLGEAICLHSGIKAKIIRISNVYSVATPNKPIGFLGSVLGSLKSKECIFNTTPNSTRNFVHIDDVTDIAMKIIKNSDRDIYHIASAENISNSQIDSILKRNGIDVKYGHDISELISPCLDIDLIANEFYTPRNTFLGDFDALIKGTY